MDYLHSASRTKRKYRTQRGCFNHWCCRDWVVSRPNLVIVEEGLEEVDTFNHSVSCTPPSGHLSDKVTFRVPEARLTFTHLRHLLPCRDIRSLTAGRVYTSSVRLAFFYGSETWELTAENAVELPASKQLCL